MIALITGIVGIISAYLVWRWDTKRRIYSELDRIYHRLDQLYKERDAALHKNNTDRLSRVTVDILRLLGRKKLLYKRLGQNS